MCEIRCLTHLTELLIYLQDFGVRWVLGQQCDVGLEFRMKHPHEDGSMIS